MNDDIKSRYDRLRMQADDLESQARRKEKFAQNLEDEAPMTSTIGGRSYLESLDLAERCRQDAKQFREDRQKLVELGRNLRRLYPELNAQIIQNLNTNPR